MTRGLALFMVVLFGVVVVVIAYAVASSAGYTDRCHRMGGHVVNLGKSAVCVSHDGRVLEP